VLGARHHAAVHRAAELKADTVLKLFETTDAFRRPERFAECCSYANRMLAAARAWRTAPIPRLEYLRRARDAAAAVQLSDEASRGAAGPAIGAQIRARRLEAVTRVKQEFEGQLT